MVGRLSHWSSMKRPSWSLSARYDCVASATDETLKETLLSELPGILNWAIEGCLKWQRNGAGALSSFMPQEADVKRERSNPRPDAGIGGPNGRQAVHSQPRVMCVHPLGRPLIEITGANYIAPGKPLD